MKNVFRNLIIIFLTFFIVACVSATHPSVLEPGGAEISKSINTSSPSTPSSTPTLTPTLKSKPTLDVFPTVTATLAPTMKSGVEKKCLTILPELRTDRKYSGQIVLKSLGSPYLLYDVGTGEKYEIPQNPENKVIVRTLAVSPERTLYAYEYYGSDQLVIASSDHKIKRIVAIPDLWHFSRWQNDKSLLFVIYEPTDDPHWGNYPPTLGLFNTFTGEKQVLAPDFPDIDKANPILRFEESGITVYDPTMSRVVYEREDWNVILWDIPNKKQLAQLPLGGLGVTVPLWLPDGSKYIMMAKDGYFYLVTRDGLITQVSFVKMDAELFSWSPDNRHIAFWRVSPDLEDRTLHLLDTKTGQMSDLCITIGYNPEGGYGATAPIPIWSPDGSGMAVGANFNENTQGSDLLLLDLDENTAVKIGENTSPVGWLSEP